MGNPYFSVGEEVVICSKHYPEINGDNTIISVLNNDEMQLILTSMGDFHTTVSGYFYELDIDIEARVNSGKPTGVKINHLNQSALRKKHKPSTDPFTEMMSNINELVTQ